MRPEHVYAGWSDHSPEYKTIEINSELKLKVECVDKDNFKIDQVISSNPGYYLQNKITPGTTLSTNELLTNFLNN